MSATTDANRSGSSAPSVGSGPAAAVTAATAHSRDELKSTQNAATAAPAPTAQPTTAPATGAAPRAGANAASTDLSGSQADDKRPPPATNATAAAAPSHPTGHTSGRGGGTRGRGGRTAFHVSGRGGTAYSVNNFHTNNTNYTTTHTHVSVFDAGSGDYNAAPGPGGGGAAAPVQSGGYRGGGYRGRRRYPHSEQYGGAGGDAEGDAEGGETGKPQYRDRRRRGSAAEGEEGERDQFNRDNYKTEVCRTFMQHNYCEYEDNCQFAHGVHELRTRHFGPKYKTQLCKNYHNEGTCRFGSRCKFIHDEQRVRVSEKEFWLVSPSENLIRVEMVNDPQRQAELAALVVSQDRMAAVIGPGGAALAAAAAASANTPSGQPQMIPVPVSMPPPPPPPQPQVVQLRHIGIGARPEEATEQQLQGTASAPASVFVNTPTGPAPITPLLLPPNPAAMASGTPAQLSPATFAPPTPLQLPPMPDLALGAMSSAVSFDPAVAAVGNTVGQGAGAAGAPQLMVQRAMFQPQQPQQQPMYFMPAGSPGGQMMSMAMPHAQLAANPLASSSPHASHPLPHPMVYYPVTPTSAGLSPALMARAALTPTQLSLGGSSGSSGGSSGFATPVTPASVAGSPALSVGNSPANLTAAPPPQPSQQQLQARFQSLSLAPAPVPASRPSAFDSNANSNANPNPNADAR